VNPGVTVGTDAAATSAAEHAPASAPGEPAGGGRAGSFDPEPGHTAGFDALRRYLRRVGVAGGTALITALSVVLSVVLTLGVSRLAGAPAGPVALGISVLAPALIAPPFTLMLLALVARLDAAERTLSRLSAVDSLTKVYNRRGILQLAHSEYARARRTGEALSVAILDVDRFKQINDTYGHPGGDAVLRALAGQCAAHSREVDHFGRYGGEEFMYVLPSSSPGRAAEFAERIRTLLASDAVRYRDRRIVFTVSIGVTSLGEREDLDALLLRADEALYSAKRSGRNRVVVLPGAAPTGRAGRRRSTTLGEWDAGGGGAVMTEPLDHILYRNDDAHDPRFPHAPAEWTREAAERIARAEGLQLGEDHWDLVRALQEFFARHADHPQIRFRELHDALEERFHRQGGVKYLYGLFPGGPVAQGCRVAGFTPPAGTVDRGFGSVV